MSTASSHAPSCASFAPAPSELHQNKNRCCFTFATGKQCRMPRQAGHSFLCTFHARKESQAQAAAGVGEEVAGFLSGAYVSACDLNSALGHLFVAVARGDIKPRTASNLAYLGQTMVQALPLAQHEYINAFGTNAWRSAVRSSFAPGSAASPSTSPAASSAASPQAQPQ